MGAISLPYVRCQHSKGRTYLYYRRGGRDIRLPDPNDPGFMPVYQTIHAAAEAAGQATVANRPAPVLPGSMAALVIAYRSSETWQDLAPATRQDYDKALNPLRDRFGHLPVATLPRSFVFALRDQYAVKSENGTTIRTPRRANRMVNTLRLLLAWAVDRGWRSDNPAARPGRLRTGEGYITWTADQFRQFTECDAIGEPLKRAAALAWFTGARKGDCLTLVKSARKGGAIELVPEKTRRSTGARVWIP
jgi:hypothetical protein